MRSETNETEDAESNKPQASIIEPFGASINNLQVMSSTLVLNSVAAAWEVDVTEPTADVVVKDIALSSDSFLDSVCNKE